MNTISLPGRIKRDAIMETKQRAGGPFLLAAPSGLNYFGNAVGCQTVQSTPKLTLSGAKVCVLP